MKLIVEISDNVAMQYKDLKSVVHHELYSELHKVKSEEDITVTELDQKTQELIELGRAVKKWFEVQRVELLGVKLRPAIGTCVKDHLHTEIKLDDLIKWGREQEGKVE